MPFCSLYSFIEYLEFFRIDFRINLSSFLENMKACEWKEHVFHWHGLLRTATALLDTETQTVEKRTLPPSN